MTLILSKRVDSAQFQGKVFSTSDGRLAAAELKNLALSLLEKP
jgi:hypothetical protein